MVQQAILAEPNTLRIATASRVFSLIDEDYRHQPLTVSPLPRTLR